MTDLVNSLIQQNLTKTEQIKEFWKIEEKLDLVLGIELQKIVFKLQEKLTLKQNIAKITQNDFIFN